MISLVENRVGGHPPNIRDMKKFNKAIDRAKSMEVNFDGSPFTWTNHRLW